jgi:hypothetical protein
MSLVKSKSIGILTVATNIYVDYWINMVRSLDKNLTSGQLCTVHVFTDQPDKAIAIQSELVNLRVFPHLIPAYGWPDATIRRYEIINEFASEINESVLMHLDADMLVMDNFFEEIISIAEQNRMMLVSHPGFWNKKISIRQKLRARINGSKATLGSWETRQESLAYVEPRAQTNYVCGGVWAGPREIFFEAIEALAEAVSIDRENGIIAVWHDESHLNNWASRNDYIRITPAYCFVEEYAHLAGLKPKILAVTKEVRTRK